jgi:ferredoxin-NADP reductase
MARSIEERAAKLGIPVQQPEVDPTLLASELKFDIYTYICGLNFMVSSVRERLAAFGWHKKQVVFERYD